MNSRRATTELVLTARGLSAPGTEINVLVHDRVPLPAADHPGADDLSHRGRHAAPHYLGQSTAATPGAASSGGLIVVGGRRVAGDDSVTSQRPGTVNSVRSSPRGAAIWRATAPR